MRCIYIVSKQDEFMKRKKNEMKNHLDKNIEAL